MPTGQLIEQTDPEPDQEEGQDSKHPLTNQDETGVFVLKLHKQIKSV